MNIKKIFLPAIFEKYNLLKYFHILFNKKKLYINLNTKKTFIGELFLLIKLLLNSKIACI